MAIISASGKQPSLRSLQRLSRTHLAAFMGLFVAVGGVAVAFILASGVFSSYEPENGTITNGATVVNNSGASGGKAVKLTAVVATPTPTATPTTTPPPVGSAGYPARWTVGAPELRGTPYRQSDASLPVPAGYTVINPSNNTSKEYDMYSCSGTTTLDHVYIKAFIYVGTGCHGTINITNSIIAPPAGSTGRSILVNADSSASLTINITDTTIRPEPVPTGGRNDALTDHALNDCATCHITMTRVDVANSGGMCECGLNTLVQYSWLHDNYIAHLSDPSLAHTGGVFPYGGSGPLEVSHNRLEPGVNAYSGTEVPNYWQAITAVLFTQSSGGSVLRNYYVHDNFISLGAFDMFLEDGQGITVTNNVFGPNHWGETTTCSSGCSVTYANWSGNVKGDISGNPTNTTVAHP